MRHYLSLFLIGMLFASFQCQRWASYTKHIHASVKPDTVILTNDTIDFLLTFNNDGHDLNGEKGGFTVYAVSDDHAQMLAEFENTTGAVKKLIRQKINPTIKINSIGLKLKKEGKRNMESPILPIAVVDDRR
ncbi:MAG TPA: hypothetical protein VGD40_22130 [Chryseosolibacter sp.]